MKTGVLVLTTIVVLSGCASTQEPSSPIGTLKKGTLSNQKLIRDTMVGVAMKVAVMGCQKIDYVQPYVVAMPQGEPGSRYWREKWVVKGCSTEYPVAIRFKEAGPNAADYFIE